MAFRHHETQGKGMAEALSSFRKYLSGNNLKLTQQRALIFKVFMSGQGQVSPEELLTRVQEVDESVSRSTIYRTVKHLHGAGIARCIHQGDGITYYEPMGDQSCRMICERCGRSIPVSNPYLECVQQETARQQGFTLFRWQSVLYGLCRECSAGERAGPPGGGKNNAKRQRREQ